MDNWIVAEVNEKNWPEEGQPYQGMLLSQLFEDVINVNAARGYLLHSFQLCRVFGPREGLISETIIAVFQRGTLLSTVEEVGPKAS